MSTVKNNKKVIEEFVKNSFVKEGATHCSLNLICDTFHEFQEKYTELLICSLCDNFRSLYPSIKDLSIPANFLKMINYYKLQLMLKEISC